MATISSFEPGARKLVRETVEKVKGFNWKVYVDPSAKSSLVMKLYGNRICALYPCTRGFSIGYWDAPAGRRGVDRWVRHRIGAEKELKIHLAMIRARVFHVLTGTP